MGRAESGEKLTRLILKFAPRFSGWVAGSGNTLCNITSHTSGYNFHIIPYVNAGGAGKIGVWLFFVLSAFLLTGRLCDLANKNSLNVASLGSYAIARVARIFPIYTFALLAYIMHGSLPKERFFENLIFTNTIFWPIPVELQYYALLPILVLVLKRVFAFNLTNFTIFYASIVTVIAWFFPPTLASTNSTLLAPYLAIFMIGTIGAIASR